MIFLDKYSFQGRKEYGIVPLWFVLGQAYRGLPGEFLLPQIFSVAISVSHVCFILDLILISMFLRKCTYELGIFHAN